MIEVIDAFFTMNGVVILLIVKGKVPKEKIAEKKRELRNERDVVGFIIERKK